MKKIFILLVAAVIMITAGCSETEKLAISEEEALVILGDLAPKSAEINGIFFGDGLKAVSEAYAEEHTETAYYPVEDGCPYKSIDDIKREAEKVYSAKYLASVYISMFDGISSSDENGGYGTISPRYKMIGDRLNVNAAAKSFGIREIAEVKSARKTDSGEDYASFDCECLLKDGTTETVRLTLAGENGKWLLDGPAY